MEPRTSSLILPNDRLENIYTRHCWNVSKASFAGKLPWCKRYGTPRLEVLSNMYCSYAAAVLGQVLHNFGPDLCKDSAPLPRARSRQENSLRAVPPQVPQRLLGS